MSLLKSETSNDDITIYFVQGTTSSNKDMKRAFSACQGVKLKPIVVDEGDVRDLPQHGKIVYVVEQFSGETFKYLATKDCVVVGPSCLFNCITKMMPIPDNECPVFSTAMVGVVVTASKMPRAEKDELATVVGYMGGVYIDQLTNSVTHLISNEGRSPKCEKAIEHQIPIMTSNWVKGLWEASCKREVTAGDAEFCKYRLPPFKGMRITCTNLPQSTKRRLQAIIESGGGIYMPTLGQNKTTILIVGEAQGQKFQHAQLWDIPCVKPSWLYDSAEKGAAVSPKDHLVIAKPKCSTPTSDLPSFMTKSDISVVPFAHNMSNGAINETNLNIASTCSTKSLGKLDLLKSKALPENDYKKFIDEIDFAEVSKAGLFLDGCKIFLSGFNPMEIDRLKKVVNRSGATFFTQITDRLSHVVVGAFDLQDAKTLAELNPRPHTVSIEWLLVSIRQKCAAPIQPYECLTNSKSTSAAPPSSPLSHKGLELLKTDLTTNNENTKPVSRKLFVKVQEEYKKSSETLAVPPPPEDDKLNMRAQEEINLMRKQNNAETVDKQKPPEKTDQNKEPIREISSLEEAGPFFEGLVFNVIGFDDPTTVVNSIEAVGGSVQPLQSKGKVNYAIVPLAGINGFLNAKEIVTGFWVEDCYDQGKVVEVDYFHQPVDLKENVEPLSGTVICITGFIGKERSFICHIATTLGAVVQDSLSRKDHSEKNILRSTHLVCKSPTGSKYKAAVKWGVSVIRKEWIMASLQSGSLPPIEHYTLDVNEQTVDEPMKTPGGGVVMTDEKLVSPMCTPVQNGSNSVMFPSKKKVENQLETISPVDENEPKPSTSNFNHVYDIKWNYQDLSNSSKEAQLIENENCTSDSLELQANLSNKEKKRTLPNKSWDGPSKSKKMNADDEIEVWDFVRPRKSSFLEGLNDNEASTEGPELKKIKQRIEPNLTGVNKAFENTQVIEDMLEDDEDEDKGPKIRRVFVISNIPASSRGKYEGIIKNLGGEVSTQQCFDIDSTHLVIERPVRSEKLLCSIASGKWVLHLSYLTQCYQSRTFLPEEDYEWGNERSWDRLPHVEPGTTEYDLAKAAYKWRQQRVHISKPCAFRNFKAVLCTSQNKLPQYKRLLEAGGATVLPDDKILEATHVFWDEHSELPICKTMISNKKIHILKPIYLGDYLTKTPHPDPKKYYC